VIAAGCATAPGGEAGGPRERRAGDDRPADYRGA
jgi:hypothetical protein